MNTFWVDIKECIWQSDFDGVDCGYDDLNVVSFWVWNEAMLEVNAETGEILNISSMGESEIQ